MNVKKFYVVVGNFLSLYEDKYLCVFQGKNFTMVMLIFIH
jgi:hypothetical protein